VTRRRALAGLCAVVSLTGLSLATASPAAAAQGVAVQIGDLPDRFAAGARPETLTVVASKRGGRDCLKVRWSMVMEVEGMRIDQVRVDRVEDNGQFPLDVQAEGNTARFTDLQLDPGTLCRDRTVTARYEVNFANDVASGRVKFSVEAYDEALKLLERDTVTRTVEGATPVPTESPTAAPEDQAGQDAVEPDPSAQAQVNPSPTGTRIALPPVGFLVGALMLFLGFGLLLQVYRRMRRRPAGAGAPVAGDPREWGNWRPTSRGRTPR